MSLKSIIEKAAPHLIIGVLAVGISTGIVLGLSSITKRDIRLRDEKTEPGYVIPSKLKVPIFRDLDGNGKDEVLLKYKGKSYLLMEDKQGNPVIRQYTITPSQVNVER